ncbi:MAG: hypothetical protein V4850_30675 [Myxococcota bacterium]
MSTALANKPRPPVLNLTKVLTTVIRLPSPQEPCRAESLASLAPRLTAEQFARAAALGTDDLRALVGLL